MHLKFSHETPNIVHFCPPHEIINLQTYRFAIPGLCCRMVGDALPLERLAYPRLTLKEANDV